MTSPPSGGEAAQDQSLHVACGGQRYSIGRFDYFMMIFDKAALALVIIGALNWGGIGLFGFDTVAWLCGGQLSLISRIIYTLVGLAGLWCISILFKEIRAEG